MMAAIPAEAADDAVLTKQLAVERYATALLVRLRRIKRNRASQGEPRRLTMIVSVTKTARIKRHGPPEESPPSGRGPAARARPEPDARRTLVTMAIRAAGTHQFVYRKMLEGPVGAATPNHGDIVRVVDRDGSSSATPSGTAGRRSA